MAWPSVPSYTTSSLRYHRILSQDDSYMFSRSSFILSLCYSFLLSLVCPFVLSVIQYFVGYFLQYFVFSLLVSLLTFVCSIASSFLYSFIQTMNHLFIHFRLLTGTNLQIKIEKQILNLHFRLESK